MRFTISKTLTALILLGFVVLGSVGPDDAAAQSGGASGRNVCENWHARSRPFQNFLAANPRLSAQPINVQLRAFRIRGRAEWQRIFDVTSGMTLGSAFSNAAQPDGSASPAIADDRGAAADASTGYRLGADNPLPLIRRFILAYSALRSQDNALALDLAESALAEASPRWGADNAGLVLGHLIMAESYSRSMQHRSARSAADRGLAIVAAHPERALALATYRVGLLRLRASAADSMAEEQASGLPDPANPPAQLREQAARDRADAAAEIRRRSLPFATPFFNIFALIPGLQPASEWNEQHRQVQLPLLASFADMISIAAGAIPSVRSEPVRSWELGTVDRTAPLAGQCLQALADAAFGGDFQTTSMASSRLAGLLSERNLLSLLNQASSGDEDWARPLEDTWADVVETLENDGANNASGPLMMFGIGSLYLQGQYNETVGRVEQSLTPRVMMEVLALSMRESDPDERRRINGVVSRYRADLSRAILYLRTAFVMMLREPRQGDARTMSDASAWLSGPGAQRIREFEREIASAGGEAPDETYFDGRGGQTLLRWLPAVFDSFAWASARSLGDVRTTRASEARIYAVYRRHFESTDPARLRAVAPALSMLERGTGSPGDRSMRALPPVMQSIAREILGADFSEGGEDEEPGGEIMADIVTASFLIPLAAAEQRWEDIVRVGDPVVTRFTALLDSADAGAPNLFGLRDLPAHPGFQTLGQPIAYYLYALHRTGRGRDAARTLDRFLPSLREVERSGREDARIGVATVLPDRLLESAVVVYAGLGRIDDALLVARIRTRKAQLNVGIPSGWGRPDPIGGLRLDTNQPIDRPAFEQLLELAERAPDTPQRWDDILTAVDASKRSEAGDALLLRSMAAAAGPSALSAYDEYLGLVARRQSRSGPDGLVSRRQDSAEALTRQIINARARLVQRINQALPNPGNLTSAQTSMSALRQALRPGELAVSTMVAGDRIAIVTLTREGPPTLTWARSTYSQLTPVLSAIEQSFHLTGDYQSAATLRRPDPDHLARLYAALLGPVDVQVRAAQHIIWAPDVRLAQVPIGALRAQQPFVVPGEQATEYLGLARSITVTPSLAGLVNQRRIPSPPNTSPSVAIGDLPFGSTPGLGGFSLTPNAGASLAEFARLTGGRAITGSGATLSALQGLGRQPLNLLMVYTHGLGAQTPRGPALVFMPSGTPESALAQPADIMRLGIRPNLVLLAACSTGDFDSSGVAPYGGIVRSFLVLGPRGVLAAQRRVDEEATSRLITALVDEMTRNRRTPSQALRVAQRRIAAQGYDNPVLWAQLLWVGDAG